MIELGQLCFGLSLIVLFLLTRLRTSNLTKVDNNRRSRKGLSHTKELYQGRMLRYLFSFEKEVTDDTPVDKILLLETKKIDRIMIICSILLIISLLSFL